MNPVIDKVAEWREQNKQAALATVVKVERSGPLGTGDLDGRFGRRTGRGLG